MSKRCETALQSVSVNLAGFASRRVKLRGLCEDPEKLSWRSPRAEVDGCLFVHGGPSLHLRMRGGRQGFICTSVGGPSFLVATSFREVTPVFVWPLGGNGCSRFLALVKLE